MGDLFSILVKNAIMLLLDHFKKKTKTKKRPVGGAGVTSGDNKRIYLTVKSIKISWQSNQRWPENTKNSDQMENNQAFVHLLIRAFEM